MKSDSLNSTILTTLREKCANNNVYAFLINLLYEEACKKGNWKWKEYYIENVEAYSKPKGDKNEN